MNLNRVLVTGGAGFIGGHVVDKLLAAGYEVRVLDDLSNGSLVNIERLREVDFVKGDVCDTGVARESVRGVDAVVHLAAMTSVPFSVQHPDLTVKVNVGGTENLVGECQRAKVKRFVFASSASVYGDPCYLPIDENHPTRPLSPYAASKLNGEMQCKVSSEDHGLETVVLRLFNVYGPRQTMNAYSGVITQFMNRIKKGLPLIIFGDGGITRDFVHVWDVADALLMALKLDCVKGEAFNIGFGEATTLDRLAKTVLDLAGKDLGIVYEKPRVGDVKASYANISKAEKLLNYKPMVSLEKGLQTLVSRPEADSAKENQNHV